MRVIFDTNIFISMLIWRDKRLELIYESFLQKYFDVYLAPEMIQELERVLNYSKFQKYLLQANLTIDEVIEAVISYCFVIKLPRKIARIVENDPSDDMFLACAIESKADFIVSGDKHLLALKSFQGILILTPQQFLDKINNI